MFWRAKSDFSDAKRMSVNDEMRRRTWSNVSKTCAESNANEKNLLFWLVCVRFEISGDMSRNARNRKNNKYNTTFVKYERK